MKKLVLLTSCVLLPFTASAAESARIRPFVEYGQTLFASTTTKVKLDGVSLGKEDTTELNGGGELSVGLDYNGIQLAFAPSYLKTEDSTTTSLMLRLDVPFLQGKLQPYLSIGAGVGFISMDEPDISEAGFEYDVAVGVKYSFNDNVFVKGSFGYSAVTFNPKVYGYDMDIDMNAFTINTSLGYRF